MPSFYPENNTPLPSDDQARSLKKINSLLYGGGGGGYPGGGNFAGDGSPEGVQVASPGARYLDKIGKMNYTKVSGENTNTGWE